MATSAGGSVSGSVARITIPKVPWPSTPVCIESTQHTLSTYTGTYYLWAIPSGMSRSPTASFHGNTKLPVLTLPKYAVKP